MTTAKNPVAGNHGASNKEIDGFIDNSTDIDAFVNDETLTEEFDPATAAEAAFLEEVEAAEAEAADLEAAEAADAANARATASKKRKRFRVSPDTLSATEIVKETAKEAAALRRRAQSAKPVPKPTVNRDPLSAAGIPLDSLVDISIEHREPLAVCGATAVTAWVKRLQEAGQGHKLRDTVVVRREIMLILDRIVDQVNRCIEDEKHIQNTNFVSRQFDKSIPEPLVDAHTYQMQKAPTSIPVPVALAAFEAAYQPVVVDQALVMIYVDDPDDDSFGCHVPVDGATLLWVYDITGQTLSDNQLTSHVGVWRRRCPEVTQGVNADLIALNNGIFNYAGAELLPFNRSHVFLSKSSVNYNPDASSPVIDTGRDIPAGHLGPDAGSWEVMTWLRDLAAGDDDVFTLMLQGIHAALRPTHKWGKMLVLYSPVGNNGKGTYLDLLREVVGEDNAVTISLDDMGTDFGLSQLLPVAGRVPCLITSDENDSRYLDKMAAMKSLITQNQVRVNEKHEKARSLRWRGLIVQCVNEIPRTRDTGNSVSRRWLTVPFLRNFGNGAEKIPEIPEIEQDYIHRPGVLEYLVKAVLDKDILPAFSKFIIPSASTDLEHDQALDSDPVNEFWEEFREELVWGSVPINYLYDLYLAWSKKVNPSGSPTKRRTFSATIKRLIQAGDDIWDYPDGPQRMEAAMVLPEPLSKEYALGDWLDWGHPDSQLSHLVPDPDRLKPFYRGITAKVQGPPPQPLPADPPPQAIQAPKSDHPVGGINYGDQG